MDSLGSSKCVVPLVLLVLLSACGGSSQPITQGNPDGGGDAAPQAPTVLVDGATCVDIEITAADFSCSTDDDCTLADTGVMCIASCGCPGGTPLNRAAAERIASELERASLPRPMGCPAGCGVFGHEYCVHGVCTMCTFSPPRAPGCPADGG